MKEMQKNKKRHSDVIERYCPKRGENVIMQRTFGQVTQLKCMNYNSCANEKDEFCGVESEG